MERLGLRPGSRKPGDHISIGSPEPGIPLRGSGGIQGSFPDPARKGLQGLKGRKAVQIPANAEGPTRKLSREPPFEFLFPRRTSQEPRKPPSLLFIPKVPPGIALSFRSFRPFSPFQATTFQVERLGLRPGSRKPGDDISIGSPAPGSSLRGSGVIQGSFPDPAREGLQGLKGLKAVQIPANAEG